jgi:hypothetical protein
MPLLQPKVVHLHTPTHSEGEQPQWVFLRALETQNWGHLGVRSVHVCEYGSGIRSLTDEEREERAQVYKERWQMMQQDWFHLGLRLGAAKVSCRLDI